MSNHTDPAPAASVPEPSAMPEQSGPSELNTADAALAAESRVPLPASAGRTGATMSSGTTLDAVRSYLSEMGAGITEPVRIREEELASRLGVSRTPVREALIRLDATGLVSLRPGRGALLQPVTSRDYAEWLQVREAIEGIAARESALNATGHDIARLRRLFVPFAEPGATESAPDRYAIANVEFHQILVDLSGNALLARVWQSFGHLQTSRNHRTISRLHRGAQSLAEHLQIIDAIERRDADAAERLARIHVQHLRHAFDADRAAEPAIGDSADSVP